MKRKKNLAHILCASSFALLSLAFFAPNAFAQSAAKSSNATQNAAPRDEKAEALLQRAIEVLGGRAYADVHTSVSRGLFTQIDKGVSGDPTAFVDYVALPDRERTEFKGRAVRVIQVNEGSNGWIFDGVARTISDLKPAQIEDFQIAQRTSVDNLLRGWWRSAGAQLEYAGRREAGIGKRNEVVRLTYPDGFAVEYEIGAQDFLPAKILYTRKNAEGAETTEEDRLLQYINIGGVNTPFVIDHYRAGAQTSRINYESIEYNKPIPGSLFARPTDIKKLK